MSEKKKKKEDEPLHSLLIVENTNGNLFLVENKKKTKSLKKLQKKVKKKKEKRLKKLLKKAQKMVEIELQQKAQLAKSEVKAEPTETTATVVAPPEEEYNPFLSYGSQNDVFIVDAIKSEPQESVKEEENLINFSDSIPQRGNNKNRDKARNYDDDDDFTWQQDEDDDYIFGLNSSTTKKSTKPETEAKSSSMYENSIVQIKTEPDINIKEEPDDMSEPADYDDDDDEEDDDEEFENDYQKPKRKSSSSSVKKNYRDPNVPRLTRPRLGKATRPFAIKRDPEEIEEAKKRKLTGKKACKYCATLFKTQQEVDRHKCEYLKCKPEHFICRICYKELSRNTFSNHMGYVHGDPRLQCDICSKQFKDNRKLMYHISTHTGDRPFKCEVNDCKASFISKYGLMRHMGTHGITPPTIKCRYCEKEFANNYSLRQHETQIHTLDYQFFCDFCMKGFVRKDLLAQHIQSKHLQLRPYTCSVCHYAFTLKKYLTNHFKTKHLPGIKKRYECHICNRTLSQRRSLRDHLMLHTGERKHMCENCGDTFITKTSLKLHRCENNVGGGGDCKKKRRKPDINKDLYFAKYCRYCGVTFDTWAERDLHQCPYLVNASDPKYYICRFCNKEIVRNSYSSHSTVHSEASHECSVCSRMFKSRKTLKQHMWIHTENKKYKCDQCDKSYSKKEGLLIHMGEHGMPVPTIQCDQCPKTFHAIYRLNDHKKRVHEHPELYSKKKMKKDNSTNTRREVTVIQYHQEPPPMQHHQEHQIYY